MTLKKTIRCIGSALFLLIFVLVSVFPVAPNAQAQTVPLPVEPRPLDFSQPTIDTQSGIVGDITRGALNLAVCSGGSLTDRLKAAGQGAIDATVEYGVREVLKWANEDGKGLLEDIAAIGATAAFPVVGGLLSGILGLGGGSRGPTVVDAPELQSKDACLDAMARMTAQQVIQEVAWGVVNWIQGGYGGNPGFATNVDRRLSAIAERELRRQVNRLVYGQTGQDVCSAFKDSVAISYITNYYQRNPDVSGEVPIDVDALIRAKNSRHCNLGQAADAAVDEVVTTASWLSGDQWRDLGQNNPYQLYARTSEQIASSITESQERELAQLTWSGGFIPWETCSVPAEAGDDGWLHPLTGDVIYSFNEYPQNSSEKPCIEYETATPGSIVQSMVADVIGSDIRRAEVADEFNEIVADAGNLLITKITEGREGLRGASDFAVTNQGNFDAAVNQYNADLLLDSIRNALAIERPYLARFSAVVELLSNQQTENLLSTAESCQSTTASTRQNTGVLANYLYEDFLEYSSLKQKLDWKGNLFNWQPFVIRTTDPVPIDWEGQPWNWPEEENIGNRRFQRPGEDVGSGSSVTTFGIAPYFLMANGEGGQDGSAIRDLLSQMYINYEPYIRILPGFASTYGYVWGKGKGQSGENGEWSTDGNASVCPFFVGGWCYHPAYTQRKVEIISPVTYQEGVSGEIEPSDCRTIEDEGNHYFVLNGEDVWRVRVCSSELLSAEQVQWADQVIPAQPNTSAEKVLQNTTATGQDAFGDLEEIRSGSDISSLTSQQILVEDLERLERELTSSTNNYNSVYAEYVALEHQLHTQSDVNDLLSHLNRVVGLLRSINDDVVANCGATSIRDFIDETIADVATTPNGPVKISWLTGPGNDFAWVSGIQYRLGENNSPEPAGIQCNLQTASPFEDEPGHATAHYRITTAGTSAGSQYRERWGLFICVREIGSNRTEWREVNGYSVPAWRLN